MVNVLAIVPYHTNYCAGQRFRVENWANELVNRGIIIEFLPFTNSHLTDVLHKPNNGLKKAYLLIEAFIKQLSKVIKAKKPDILFIYREAALAGPAIIERIVKRWNIPIIYDIDEPLFVPYLSPANGSMSRLKFFSKIDKILEMSDKVFVVNQAIADYATKFNKNVYVVPNTVDIHRYKPDPNKIPNKKPIIAWVGTRTNQPNIYLVVPALQRLRKEHDFIFRIIADDPMEIEGLDVEFVQWKYDVEVPMLQQADIGITPVKESVWSPCKFFFKTIQYMSLGLPVVGIEMGSNIEVIDNGVNGFLVKNEEEWYTKLKLLIENSEMRVSMGNKARDVVIERFTLEHQFDFIEQQFKEASLKTV